MRAEQEVDFVTFFQAERALNPVEPSSRTKKCKINSLGKKDSPSPTKQQEESKQYSPSGGCWSVWERSTGCLVLEYRVNSRRDKMGLNSPSEAF